MGRTGEQQRGGKKQNEDRELSKIVSREVNRGR